MTFGNRSSLISILLLAGMITVPASGFAAVQLHFSPVRQHVAVGETGSVSVMLDDAVDVRTIEIWVSFDSSVVSSVRGDSGAVFAETGCSLFPVFEDPDPGEWYAGTVALGPTCWATGPGELYRWTFTGAADGVCPVSVDSVKLYDPLAARIADVSMTGAVINVGAVTAVGPPAPPLTLDLAPNPFNPRTLIRCEGRPGEVVSVAVFDLGGRLVADLWRGEIVTGGNTVVWNGCYSGGRTAPGGVYVFRILGEKNRRSIRKGILLK